MDSARGWDEIIANAERHVLSNHNAILRGLHVGI